MGGGHSMLLLYCINLPWLPSKLTSRTFTGKDHTYSSCLLAHALASIPTEAFFPESYGCTLTQF